jgi:hypothetical protein
LSRKKAAPQAAAEPPGCLIACIMITIGLVIVFYPHPFWLTIGVGMLVPPVAYLVYALDRHGTRASERFLPPSRKQQLAVSSFFLALALAVRAWRDDALIDHLPFVLTCVGISAVLSLLVHLVRGEVGMPHFRFVFFLLYALGALGLANTRFDRSAPLEVQGYVVEIDIRKHSGRGKPRYYRVMPFLKSEAGDIRVAPFKNPPVQVGAPVCTSWHPGAVGFAWFETRIGRCAQR